MEKKMLGILIRMKMEEKGLTYRAVAENIGMAYKTLHTKCIKGNFDFFEAMKILEFFNMSVDEVMEFTKAEKLNLTEWKTY